MSRESAALGDPVYSIFRGKMGAVDRYLAKEKRLTIIEKVEDVKATIRPVNRTKMNHHHFSDKVALQQIFAAIIDIVNQQKILE